MSAPWAGDVSTLLRPLEVAHLGVLARGHAVAAPELRAKHVVQVLRDLFHFACTEQVVASVYEKVLREAPELLGGAPLQLHGVVPEATLIQPVTTRCVDCGCALDVQPAHVALAFLLHMGWKEVAWRRATCRSCHAWYSNVWCSRPGARASCFCVAAPEDVDFLQIVACPRKNGKAFIEVRALWLMRAALLRVRAPFSGFVEMLADLHALPADRKHDCLRFEQHWLLLEALTLLWHRAPHVLRSVAWPLDGQHQTQAWQGILERILPLLSGLVRDIHFREHVCHLCAVPAVTLDAKYGMTCSLCNHREGRVVEYPAINCSVMFGCQRGPAPGHLRLGLYQPWASCPCSGIAGFLYFSTLSTIFRPRRRRRPRRSQVLSHACSGRSTGCCCGPAHSPTSRRGRSALLQGGWLVGVVLGFRSVHCRHPGLRAAVGGATRSSQKTPTCCGFVGPPAGGTGGAWRCGFPRCCGTGASVAGR